MRPIVGTNHLGAHLDRLSGYEAITRTEMSERQAYRWVNGELKRQPYAHSQAALEEMSASRPLACSVRHTAVGWSSRHGPSDRTSNRLITSAPIGNVR